MQNMYIKIGMLSIKYNKVGTSEVLRCVEHNAASALSPQNG
jgi:hypothetical protein